MNIPSFKSMIKRFLRQIKGYLSAVTYSKNSMSGTAARAIGNRSYISILRKVNRVIWHSIIFKKMRHMVLLKGHPFFSNYLPVRSDSDFYFRKCNFCGGKRFEIFKQFDNKFFPDKIYRDQKRSFTGLKNKMRLQYVKCASCGLIFINPLTHFSEIDKHSFDGECNIVAWRDFDFSVYSAEKEGIIKAFYDYFDFEKYRKKNSILDVSCGPAVSLNWLRNQKKWNIYGIDPDRYSVRIAKEKYNVCIENGLIQDIGKPDEFFDFILMDNALEHYFNPLSALLKASKLLRKGGAILIIVPNADGLSTKYLDANYGWGHWFFYTPKTLYQILHKIGFKTVNLLAKQQIGQALMDKGVVAEEYVGSLQIELCHPDEIDKVPEIEIFADFFAILAEKPLNSPNEFPQHIDLLSIADSSMEELSSDLIYIK